MVQRRGYGCPVSLPVLLSVGMYGLFLSRHFDAAFVLNVHGTFDVRAAIVLQPYR